MKEKDKIKNPLSVSIFIGGIIFTVLFAYIVGFTSYFTFKKRYMHQYEEHLSSVVSLVAAYIDTEDLKKCIENGEKSEVFVKLGANLDEARLYFKLDALTIVHPVKIGDDYRIKMVVSGLLPDERRGENLREIPVPQLGDDITDFMPPGFAESIYGEYINSYDIRYAKSESVFGRDYDATITLRDSAGNPVALMTCSASLEEILRGLRQYTIVTLLEIVILMFLFVVVLTEWLRRRVCNPLRRMGEEAETFEKKSREEDDPGILLMDDKSLHRGDEVEVLANTLTNMSQSMKSFVLRLVESATQMESMKDEVTKANELAMRDSMTGVKSKAAYDQQRERLDLDIKSGDAEFGIAMIDINYLKHVNDTYGHEKGDIYIKKMCTMICDTFAHSPVFRVGGDEFVVVLIHRDYKNREILVEELKRRMNAQHAKTDAEEWQRPMAAIGIAVYDKEKDTDSDTVFKRADDAMYENKKAMKACREE
ncbi:MAG: GGDEF domain-containing protein [Lachnospiraceae bacterium]|nr:GGDEF domain-containing protein [Lachnospiraceae bacterium]